jgi:hypothetical protein
MHKRAPSGVTTRKEFIWVRSINRGCHAVGLWHPIHSAGYTVFEQVQDIFHIVSCNFVILKPQHLHHSQRHIFTGPVRQQTGARDTSRRFQPKRYHWRGLDTRSWIAWGLSVPRGDLRMVNTSSSHVKTWSVCCHSHSWNFIRRGRSSGSRCAPCE